MTHSTTMQNEYLDAEIMGGELHMWVDDNPESVLIGEYVELREIR